MMNSDIIKDKNHNNYRVTVKLMKMYPKNEFFQFICPTVTAMFIILYELNVEIYFRFGESHCRPVLSQLQFYLNLFDW